MSKKIVSPLHIEWTPERVRAVNILTGETASGATLSELSSLVTKHRQALVGVGRNLVFLKTIRLPKAAPEDIRRMLDVRIAQIFPLPPQEMAYDFIQTTDQTSEGCLTILAAIRAGDLKNLHGELQKVGLTATRILPVALGSPAVAVGAGTADALVIERNARSFALDVVQGGSLRFSRMAPADSDPTCEAQRVLAAASAGDLPLVTTGDLVIPEALSSRATALDKLHEAPPFAFELADSRLKATKKRSATKTRMAVLLLTSALLLDLLVWFDRSDAMAVVQHGAATWTRQLTKLRNIREEETGKATKLSTTQATLTRAFKPAQPLSDLVAIVGDSLPPGTWLTGLSIERGKPLQIRGTAKTGDDVSHFVSALGATSRFRDVKLVFANSAKIEEKQVVQFSITAVGVGNLPMPSPVKRTVKKAAVTTTPADPTATGTGATQ